MGEEQAQGLCVGQVLGSFEAGGAQRLAYHLAAGVAAHGVRSLAIALLHAGSYTDAGAAGVELIALNARRDGMRGLIRAAFRLRRLVREGHVNVLHVHGTASLPFVVFATMGMRHRVRVVFTWQDSERVLADPSWRQRRMIWALRQCASVSGASRKIATELSVRGGLRNVGIFHGGVPEIAPAIGRTPSVPGVMWLGRIVPPKDPQALIRAASTLRARGMRFKVRIVGEPMASTAWYFEQSRARIAELGLDETVTMLGFVPDTALPGVYAQSEVAVQTSHTEGLSLALMEQMMAGMAIVATDVGDTAAAIRNEETGLLIPPRDDAALAAALGRLLSDADLRRRLGRAARELALREYSISAMARRAMLEYERVAIGSRRTMTPDGEGLRVD